LLNHVRNECSAVCTARHCTLVLTGNNVLVASLPSCCCTVAYSCSASSRSALGLERCYNIQQCLHYFHTRYDDIATTASCAVQISVLQRVSALALLAFTQQLTNICCYYKAGAATCRTPTTTLCAYNVAIDLHIEICGAAVRTTQQCACMR
jgi:hypothetical protein